MSKKLARILILPLLLLSMLSASLLMQAPKNLNLSAATIINYEEPYEIDFTGYSGSTSLQTPDTSNWSVITPSGTPQAGITTGIISLDATRDTVESNYKLNYSDFSSMKEAPDKTNNQKVLMINNDKGSQVSFGYQSKALDLKEDSFYLLTAWYKIVGNANGSVYVVNAKEDEDIKTNLAQTGLTVTAENVDGWNKVEFLIATNELSTYSVRIQLWLGENSTQHGSLGSIFFDAVSIRKITQARYENGVNTNYEQDLRTFDPASIVAINDETEWQEKAKQGNIVNNGKWPLDIAVLGETDAPLNHTAVATNVGNGLIASSQSGGYAKYVSDEFTVERFGTYLISFYAKTNGTAVANMAVTTTEYVGDNESEEKIPVNKTISSSTNVTTLNWTKHLIIIEGNAFYNAKCALELTFGTSDSHSQGYVLIDEVKIEKLNRKDYENAKNITNITIGNLNISKDASLTVQNGYFNNADSKGFNDDYSSVIFPLNNVSGWTLNTTGDINEELSGVVALPNSGEIAASQYGYAYENNVLKINNNLSGFQYYESQPLTVSSGSFYEISLFANRQTGFSGKAYVAVVGENNSVYNEILYIEEVPASSTEWINFKTAIKTSFRGINVKIWLMVGRDANNPATGTAYFDNVEFNTIDEAKYNFASNKINLDKEAFNHTGKNISGSQNYFESVSFSTENEDATVAVVPGGSSNTLLFQSTIPVFAAMQSKTSYSLSASSFYKVSFSVRITNLVLSGDAEFEEIDEDDEDAEDPTQKYGISIGLVNFDSEGQKFEFIKETKNIFGEDAYNKFEFYISTTEYRSFSPQIIIGSKNAKVAATVLLNNFEVETISNEQWNNATTESSDVSVHTIKIEGTDETSETEEEEENNKTPFEFNWFYFSTIILGLTLIVVAAAVLAKKVNWKKLKSRFKRKKEKEDNSVTYKRK